VSPVYGNLKLIKFFQFATCKVWKIFRSVIHRITVEKTLYNIYKQSNLWYWNNKKKFHRSLRTIRADTQLSTTSSTRRSTRQGSGRSRETWNLSPDSISCPETRSPIWEDFLVWLFLPITFVWLLSFSSEGREGGAEKSPGSFPVDTKSHSNQTRTFKSKLKICICLEEYKSLQMLKTFSRCAFWSSFHRRNWK
jgi:hypothetical protein